MPYTKASYKRYLKTKRWKGQRDRVMGKARGKCRFCGAKASDVHHTKYGKWGHERDADLLAVCRKCHKLLHINK